MDLKTLTDRLRGAIAACFIEEALLYSGVVLIFPHPNGVKIIGPMVIQTFLAGWLFFDKEFAGILAVAFKAYIVGLILRHILSPLPILKHGEYFILWLFAILEGAQVLTLLWLARLKKRLIQAG
jgi:hypothetical protein